jgi:hypothetical protein
LSEIEKTNRERSYMMTGISIEVYITKNGEFQWIPTTQACNDKEKANEILNVLAAMPADKRAVWRSRFDLLDAKKRCPVIRTDLENEFDKFFTAPDAHATKRTTTKQEHGGETAIGKK